MKDHRRRPAMTLVEVGAVCACLALLSSVAAPALTRLRGDDQVATCAQNLSVINQALGNLQQEFPGYYAPTFDDGGAGTSNGHFGRRTTWIDLLQQRGYIGSRDVGYCPTDRKPDSLSQQRAWAWGIKYPVALGGGNGMDHSYGISIPYSTHALASQFPCWDPDADPDRRVIASDGWWSFIHNMGGSALLHNCYDNPLWSSNTLGYRHKHAANLLHRDGHVALLAYRIDDYISGECSTDGVDTTQHFIWHASEHREVAPSVPYNWCTLQCSDYPVGEGTLDELNPAWYTQNHTWTIADIKTYKGWVCSCGGGS